MEWILLALIFIWTGFVRTGVGFGGAALGLPLLLLITDDPVYWLGIIGIHLLFFSSLSLSKQLGNIDWKYLGKSLMYIIPTALIGIFGLINLPNDVVVLFIYIVSLSYGLMWLIGITIEARNKTSDTILLLLGGYIAGTSLTGAPLIVAVMMHNVVRAQLRNTLFVLWFILVSMKMLTFISLEVKIDYEFALMMIPFAFIGHIIGLRFHTYILDRDVLFKKMIGGFLTLVSGIYLLKVTLFI